MGDRFDTPTPDAGRSRPPAGGDDGPQRVAEALSAAVDAARLAPSVHNTQPWRWHVDGDRLSLSAERSRHLAATDPDGRLLHQSCGAALYHARLALAADGWLARVDRLPEPGDPDLLARITLTGRTEPEQRAAELLHMATLRHTDRRPLADKAVPDRVLDAVAAAVAAEEIRFHVLRRDEVVELASAVSRAERVEDTDDRYRAETAAWVGGERDDRTGVPGSAVPDQAPQTRVPGRNFGPPGSLHIDAGHDIQARYALLHGEVDAPLDWLRAGEALAAAWLILVAHGLSLLPVSAVVEVAGTRAALRRLLSGIGYPYIAVRLGYPAGTAEGVPATPRLSRDEITGHGPGRAG